MLFVLGIWYSELEVLFKYIIWLIIIEGSTFYDFVAENMTGSQCNPPGVLLNLFYSIQEASHKAGLSSFCPAHPPHRPISNRMQFQFPPNKSLF